MNKKELRLLIRESFSQLLKEYVSMRELNELESYLDKFFNKLGIDIEFGRHFFERVNDVRNRKDIEIDELEDLFLKTYRKWGKRIPELGPEAEAVISDMETDINVPFVLNWDRSSGEFELLSKTVMRKRNFRTSDPKLTV
jgi:hypothetical protein